MTRPSAGRAATASAGGPLSRVLAEIAGGAGTLDEVAARTGLSRGSVDAAVDHLVRLGRLDSRELAAGCPSGGCGSCAAASGGGHTCSGPGARRSGPVLVQLSMPSGRGASPT